MASEQNLRGFLLHPSAQSRQDGQKVNRKIISKLQDSYLVTKTPASRKAKGSGRRKNSKSSKGLLVQKTRQVDFARLAKAGAVDDPICDFSRSWLWLLP